MTKTLKSVLRSTARDCLLMERTFGRGATIREALNQAISIIHDEYLDTAASNMSWAERAREAVSGDKFMEYMETMAAMKALVKA